MTELDPCPHCNRNDFGNAGARAQHVRACEKEAEKFSDGGAHNNAPRPARVDSKAAGGGAQRPDIQRSENTNDSGTLQQAGETMAGGLAGALDEDAPLETRKDGVRQLTSLLGGVVNGVMGYKERKKEEEERRAREADLQETTDKPQCECGLTFTHIPANAERISCPECGREYEVR